MKRTKLLAIFGAAALTVGTVGMALAEELKDQHTGITVGWDDEGNPEIVEGNGYEGGINGGDCENEDLEPGEVLWHFVQSGGGQEDPISPNAGGNSANNLDAWFTGADDQTGVDADDVKENNVDWFVLSVATSDEVTLDDAESDVDGGELRVSHICAGDEPGDEESEAPSESPSFEASEEAETDEPSFEGSVNDLTEPPTDTLTGNGTATPADSAWLLVVALGVLLASVVVLTPARAKSRR